nr:collagen alpha-1(I) chain-like [Vulpes vulpes]
MSPEAPAACPRRPRDAPPLLKSGCSWSIPAASSAAFPGCLPAPASLGSSLKAGVLRPLAAAAPTRGSGSSGTAGGPRRLRGAQVVPGAEAPTRCSGSSGAAGGPQRLRGAQVVPGPPGGRGAYEVLR